MKKIDKDSIGGRIRQVRMKYKLTQAEFGKEVGAVIRTVFRWEHGTTAIPTDAVIRICKEFDVSADRLLGLSDEQ